MLDIASLDHVAYCANGFFDRNIGVEPRWAIYVDMIDAEPLQRVGKEIPCGFPGRASKPLQPPAGSRSPPNLTLMMEFFALPALSALFGDQQLIMTGS